MKKSNQREVLQRVVAEAWNNPSYKQELMSNPEEAIRKLTGESVKLPKGKTLEVCDQSNADKVYLTISQKPDLSNIELTDKQLEEVAGGILIPKDFITIICTWPIPDTTTS